MSRKSKFPQSEAEDPQDEFRKMKSLKCCENDDSITKQINAEANELLQRVNDFQSYCSKTTENNANSPKKALSDRQHVIEDGPVFMIRTSSLHSFEGKEELMFAALSNYK
jgi:hypothetical protein